MVTRIYNNKRAFQLETIESDRLIFLKAELGDSQASLYEYTVQPKNAKKKFIFSHLLFCTRNIIYATGVIFFLHKHISFLQFFCVIPETFWILSG